MRTTRAWTGVVAAAALVLAACSAGPDDPPGPGAGSEPSASHSTGQDGTATPEAVALRPGERFLELAMPSPYAPSAPSGGTDDYRCFLLDPGTDEDAFVTGVDVVPGNRDVVHHVILFRVPPAQVAAAERTDRRTPGQGWTCFGGSEVGGAVGGLDDAPWIGAWAPGGGERLLDPDIGIPLEAGSRIVMQVHYNLLAGSDPDVSSARLRLADGTEDVSPLRTVLLPAPVELPCRTGEAGPLCDRKAAVDDVAARFGEGRPADGLRPAARLRRLRRCRPRSDPELRAGRGPTHHGAGGRRAHAPARPVDPDRGEPRRGGRPHPARHPGVGLRRPGHPVLDEPVRLRRGDRLQVTCTHDQGLRDLLPALEGQPERYVVWGEGTTDEMCLGIVMATAP